MISENDIDQNYKDLQTYACNKALIRMSKPNLSNWDRLIKTPFDNLIIVQYNEFLGLNQVYYLGLTTNTQMNINS